MDDEKDAKDHKEPAFGITQKQILVPELVDIHPISAQLWNQIVCIPSVYYRLNNLLLADELRETIQREAFPELPARALSEDQWEPLDYGWNRNLEDYLIAEGIIAIEEEPEQKPKKPERPVKPAEPSLLDSDFVIDTWDPSEADGIDPDILLRPPEVPPPIQMLDMHVPDPSTVGGSVFRALDSLPPDVPLPVIPPPSTGSQDEDDDIFDREINLAEGLFKIVPYKMKEAEQSELAKITQPDPEMINPTGWDDADVPLDFAQAPGDGPIQVDIYS